MQSIEQALKTTLQDDTDRLLISSIVGHTDIECIAEQVHHVISRSLDGEVVGCQRLEVSVGVAMGLTLGDGRQVMAKLHAAKTSLDSLHAVAEVQRHLNETGFPCPEVLAHPAEFGVASVTLESFVVEGDHADGHRPEIRRAMAESLAEQIDRSRRFIGLSGLQSCPAPATAGGIWPQPHNVLFDFERTSQGAEWIDAIRRRELARLGDGCNEPVVGHADWAAKHFRFAGDVITVVYDWDSLMRTSEYRILGKAAATFPCNWYLDVPRTPRPDETLAFIRDYEQARQRPFLVSELERIWAEVICNMAYTARCEHAIDQAGERLAGSWREALKVFEAIDYREL